MNAVIQPVHYVTNESGDKTGVILNITDFERLLEDMQDLADIVDRRSEPTIPHTEFLKQLREDGLLSD